MLSIYNLIKNKIKISYLFCCDYGKSANNLDNVIKKITKKYKNKRIVIYGAGIYASDIFKKYNLTEIEVVAVADMKFPLGIDCNNETFHGYKTINPYDLFFVDFDLILVTLLCANYAYDTIEAVGLREIKKFKIEEIHRTNNVHFIQSLIKRTSKKMELPFVLDLEL